MKIVRAGLILAAMLAVPAAASAQEEEAPPRVAAPKQITTVTATRTPVKTVKTDVPIARAAYSPSPAFRGEALFQQQCGVCHLGRWRKSGQLQPYAPPLTGVLTNAQPAREAAVRGYIQAGSPTMPAFRNTFTQSELDELIAYLKTL